VRRSIVSKNSFSIRSKFIIILLVTMAAITALVTIINVVQINERSNAYVLERLQSNANLTTGVFDTVMRYAFKTVEVAALMPYEEAITILFNSMNRVEDGISIYGNILIFDNDLNLIAAADRYGELICFTCEHAALHFTVNVDMARQGHYHVSPIFNNRESGLMQFLFTHPITEYGETVGIAALIGNAHGLSLFLRDYDYTERTSFVNIAGHSGIIFYSSKPEYIGIHFNDLVAHGSFWNLPRNSMFPHTSAVTGIDKITYINFDIPTGWTIISFYDADALDGIGSIIAASLAPMIASMVVSAIFLVWFINRMLAPLTTLNTAAKEVASGYLNARFNLSHNDEIAMVGESFLSVVDALKSLQNNFNKAQHAMARGDLLYRLDDASLGGAYNEILQNTNSMINEFQTFFELISEPIVIIDKGLRVRYANKIMLEYTEKENTKYPGTFINDFVNGDLSKYFFKSLREGKTLYDTEIQLQLNPHRLFDLEFSCIPFESDGNVEGAVLILTNITNVKHMQRKQIEAESASRAKSDFLSKMSHEIRTPMNAILGTVDKLLLQGGLQPEIEDAFFNIKTSSGTLLAIINDILDLSKVEAGAMEIRQEPYEIPSLIFDTLQINMMYMNDELVSFNLEITENVPAILIGDELRIKQVLNNLLSNAFKYTKNGEVSLFFDAESGKGKTLLIIEVRDTGLGMSEEQLKSLFDEYVRFDEDDNRLIEGTGLGMNITNRLIQMMDGTITPQSAPGIGSSFRVCIPQENIGTQKLDAETIKNLKNFKVSAKDFKKQYDFEYEFMPYGSVLVVDDVGSNLEVAKGLISPYGIKIQTASDGYEAVELIAAGNVYDLIFMDHMMPGMDGIETGKTIMELGYEKPIVALTANTIIGQQELFIQNGFAGFLSKPIDVSALNSYLVKYIKEAYPDEAAKAGNAVVPPPAPQGLSPAVVDSFLRDANKALEILEGLLKTPIWTADDLKLYTINTHGMKSALANMNIQDLSKEAAKLETAGNDQNTEVILSETPKFLEKLRLIVEEHTPEEDPTANPTEEDTSLLTEKLQTIKEACELYNKKSARKALDELNQHQWSKETKALLNSIATNLLHSAFEEIVEDINAL